MESVTAPYKPAVTLFSAPGRDNFAPVSFLKMRKGERKLFISIWLCQPTVTNRDLPQGQKKRN